MTTLAQIKAVLQVVTGTSIADVIMDSELYFNSERVKTYPFVLWSLDGTEFTKDLRSATIQKHDILTIPAVFVVNKYDPVTESKVTVWDTLDGYFRTYLNQVNESALLQVLGIENMRGVYLHEGDRSADCELGIMFTKVQIKTFA